ncbi:MAG: alpha/beta fold hydrolase [Actinomycetota bacterium]|nr:alpha/beta fold hydrolase [Actinomycetota bacterium]
MAQISYVMQGDIGSPAVVMIPSLGTRQEMWRDQIDLLKAYCLVITVDHLGHSFFGSDIAAGDYTIEREASAVIEVLDELEIEKASVVGISLGGMVALQLAISHPQRIDKLVVVASAPKLGNSEDWQSRAQLVRSEGTKALVKALSERWFSPSTIATRPNVVAAATTMVESISDEGYARCAEMIGACDLSNELHRITAPTLIIGGSLDKVAPPESLFNLSGKIAGSHLVVIGGANHILNLDAPESFNAELSNFILGSNFERGDQKRRAVLGDSYVDASNTRINDFNRSFFRYVTEVPWGNFWTRGVLDAKTRSIVTLSCLLASNLLEEFEIHLRGGINNGLTEDELSEIMMQANPYIGVPRVLSAMKVVAKVLSEDRSTW